MAFNPLELVGGIAVGTGVGAAVSDVVIPQLETLRQDQWAKHAVRLPGVGTLAQGVAQGQIDPGLAAEWAKRNGYDSPQFRALIDIANVGPGAAYAFELWRRGIIGEAGFRRAVQRLGLEAEWIDDLVKIKQHLLTPAEIAVMVQRSILPNPGLLPFDTQIPAGRVPPMPTINLDPIAEAAGSGIDQERLAGLTRIIGLPASPDLAARMTYRGIIERQDFDRAIAEGNTRLEWAPFLFDGFRQIPTAEQFVEGHLRGWINQVQMYAGTALHGMSKADTDLEFQIHRRPMTVANITKALARGGKFQPQQGEIQDPYSASVHQANLGPEWYDLAESLKYTIPSWFVLRAIFEAGGLTHNELRDEFLKLGWEPTLANKAADAVAGGTTATADKHVAKAQTQLWTRTHSSYIANEIGAQLARTALAAAGVPASSVQAVLQVWNEERSLIRARLTAKQLVKLVSSQAVNPATNAAWTSAEIMPRLLELGYDQADAESLLELG